MRRSAVEEKVDSATEHADGEMSQVVRSSLKSCDGTTKCMAMYPWLDIARIVTGALVIHEASRPAKAEGL